VTLVTGAVPVAQAPERLVDDGAMLVGDAARQVDPLTGGGIIIIAADAVRAGVSGRAALARNYRFLQRFPPDQRTTPEFLHLFAMAAAGA